MYENPFRTDTQSKDTGLCYRAASYRDAWYRGASDGDAW